MRNHTNDVLDFLADVHTLSKVKSMVKGLTIGVNEDTLGSILKASAAQFIALEITRNNTNTPGPAAGMARDSRKVLPWLYRYFGNKISKLRFAERNAVRNFCHQNKISAR